MGVSKDPTRNLTEEGASMRTDRPTYIRADCPMFFCERNQKAFSSDHEESMSMSKFQDSRTFLSNVFALTMTGSWDQTECCLTFSSQNH
ncbi:hypothetical protein J6590_027334 [Homalodisca vitripennis]|nr:hypothetical protein J6590_027334 [Homalodisca vitripennis]